MAFDKAGHVATTRGTQSFVHVLSDCWSRPSLLALELLWRWLFGIPLLAVLAWQAIHIYGSVTNQLAAAGIDQFSITDPAQATVITADVYAVVAPPILRMALWLVPAALVVWAVVSGVGRNAVLRRYDNSLPRRPIRGWRGSKLLTSRSARRWCCWG